MSRRRFIQVSTLAVAAAGTSAGLYTWRLEPHWLQIVSRTLAVAGLPASLEGARLVQLSDLHAGPQVADDYLLEAFARAKALKPDFVVMTGDLTSHHPEVHSHAEHLYSQMPHGRLATLGILGNHDYGAGWSDIRSADRLAAVLERQGMTVLRNAVVDVAGLQFVGMDDLWGRRFGPVEALSKVSPERAMIALSHNPDSVDLPGWDGFRGWVLSGHTHGGQIRPPFLPPPIVPVRNRRYTAGEFELPGGRRLYISRGVGHMWRLRFNVRPELTLFELHRA